MNVLDVFDYVHAEKYRGENEDYRECMNRVASALQDNHNHYTALREIMLDRRGIMGGRIQAAMGSLKNITANNCYVSATIHDSFTDGPTLEEIAELKPGEHQSVSIMQSATNAAITMRQGGGIGYDFSTLRPNGDYIRGVQAITDGPLKFASIHNAVCDATSSAGNRRGAQMLVLRCDHPDIEAFIRAKQANPDVPYELRPYTGFNFSVAITDKFMECLENGTPFPLQFEGRVYREVNAEALWEMIMRSTFDWAEPGVIFIDRINKQNNLYYCETIATTNPCGEQPLPPHGSCLLASLNLTRYVNSKSDLAVVGEDNFYMDTEQIRRDIPVFVRAMDNVVDRARYPLPEQRHEAMSKRRIGLGVTGLANALEACGAPYGSDKFIEWQDSIMSIIKNEAYRASINLAKEKGPFPLFDPEKYTSGDFIQTLDDDIQRDLPIYGIRNSHLLSVAPTGTISFSAGHNCSSGVEPVIGYSQQRRMIMQEGEVIVEVPDYGVATFGHYGKCVNEVTPEEHIAVLTTAQKHIDSAVSKTCNVPTDISYEDFKRLYIDAYEGGAKGCTTYRPNGNYEDIIKSVDKSTSEACWLDPETGQRMGSCAD